ncbi:MAG: Do family serine endopeptidase [Bacteroidales bacterium]|nr:Do family serine endopeptidase [Bacteroidales bacterium]
MKKQLILSGIVALAISITFSAIDHGFFDGKNNAIKIEHLNTTPTGNVLYQQTESGDYVPLDFTQTVDKVVNSVVHIKSSYIARNNFRNNQYRQLDPFRDNGGNDLFRYFFGPQQRENYQQKPDVQVGTGSGVIINQNGYIITNNHVIENADDIEVTLYDNRNYKATVVGTDPSTDLALIQIKEKSLPALPLVNSDDVKVGEWVMAIGNPFSLNSTVTAGIVSAKARNINILKDQYAIESFIQTDAAINPGNSGGALVNLQGGLVGINTAIASPTGSYSGYGFAVPSNIVNKVVEDLLKFGVVQRGVLGIMIRSVDGNLAKEKELDVTEGVYVDSLFENSAAEKAGIKIGDVITSIDGEKVNSSPHLQEIIANHRPGDKINVVVDRGGKEKSLEVILKNRSGSTDVVKKENKAVLDILGCELKALDSKTAKKLGIEGGVQITKLNDGKLRRNTQMREGFIITHANNKPIKSVDDFLKQLENHEGGIMIAGIYEDYPGRYYYAFGM